jgi:hypothetical protein
LKRNAGGSLNEALGSQIQHEEADEEEKDGKDHAGVLG